MDTAWLGPLAAGSFHILEMTALVKSSCRLGFSQGISNWLSNVIVVGLLRVITRVTFDPFSSLGL